ncbi:uncharacterized protein LOC117642890 isoform X2 [Thrips palmi]|uniref:Uncharacterized protein LOC117642890 isoform X2 n=1 Tax=Thrips palmi TaxID=161013 RepID=A0A6P8ZKN3_THRPL|nr:uncharacterized protein LOC117642890 isoform X2 [Thrips palmi]
MAQSEVLAPEPTLLQGDELEAVLCRALSCKASAFNLLDYSQKLGSAVNGFLSLCGSLALEVEGPDGPRTLHVFVKRADARDVTTGLDSFPRETLYYMNTVPLLEKAWFGAAARVTPDLGPAPYLATDDVVVMEDLIRRGYAGKPDWIWNALDYGAVQQCLRAQARLHAASLVLERRDGVRLAKAVPDLRDDVYVNRRPGNTGRRMFDVAADIVCDYLLPRMFHRLKVPQTKTELWRLQDETRDLFLELDLEKLLAAYPDELLVLCHGDSWPNNFLFKKDKEGRVEHVALVDFQMVRLGMPALDLLMFLHVGTRRCFRRQHQDSLLRGYHEDLLRFTRERGLDISKDFTMADLSKSVERLSFVGRAFSCSYRPVLAGDPADLAGLFVDSGKRASLMVETATRGPLVAKWYEENEKYRDMMQEAVEELLGLQAADDADEPASPS